MTHLHLKCFNMPDKALMHAMAGKVHDYSDGAFKLVWTNDTLLADDGGPLRVDAGMLTQDMAYALADRPELENSFVFIFLPGQSPGDLSGQLLLSQARLLSDHHSARHGHAGTAGF